jgi:hypothetical protein
MKKLLIIAFLALTSCNRPEPNYEGVLMTDYGRNGLESFKVVTGAQGPLLPVLNCIKFRCLNKKQTVMQSVYQLKMLVYLL